MSKAVTEKQKEKVRKTTEKWRKNNPERDKAGKLRYESEHPDRHIKRYQSNKKKERDRNKEYVANNRDKINVRRRLNRHGVSKEWHDEKMAEQNDACAICKKEFQRTPHIDHSHTCCPRLKSCDNCRRGLLCDFCNRGIGIFYDDTATLQNAIDYLNKYRTGYGTIKAATSSIG